MNEFSDNPTQSAEVPPSLPDLELLRKIGSGSYGQVWLSRNKVTGHLLAVKVVSLRPSDGADRAGREITSLIHCEVNRRKQHENLLPIYHVGQTEEALFYTMELADDVSGCPASSNIEYRPSSLVARLESGAMPPEESFRYATELLKGLACLHDAGMAHRDVKPANCLFVDGKLKLADFGLLTKTDGMVSLVGTPRYMPPDKHMDARADVYAAGLVIYEMLTGLPATVFPRWPSALLAGTANPTMAALNRVMLKACQPDPEKRFHDAGEMLKAMDSLLDGDTAKGFPFRSVGILLAGILAVAIAAVAAWSWMSPSMDGGSAPRTDVSFISIPFEAVIYVDGMRAADANGTPYATPCTITGLPARPCRVVFKKSGLPDLDVGVVDFGRQREVQARWSSATSR